MYPDFGEIIKQHLAAYPLMQPQDLVKLAFQSEFGGGHMVESAEEAAAFAEEEWQSMTPSAEYFIEDVGGGMCRLHFGGESSAAQLVGRLFAISSESKRGSAEGFAAKLEMLKAISGETAAFIADYLKSGIRPLHHSEVYRRQYDPHYRVISREYCRVFPLLLDILRLSREGRPVLIGIDGRCGSGKTGFARLCSRLMPCAVFHMDDYYLPFEKRAEDYSCIPAGNIDLERFKQDVLIPAKAGHTVHYRRYSCQSGTYLPAEAVENTALCIVEGSYSLHPRLFPYYDLTAFFTCGKEEQEKRLKKREGSYYESFQKLWIPMEELYFDTFGIEEKCRHIVCTDA